jgi:hypothetical protein
MTKDNARTASREIALKDIALKDLDAIHGGNPQPLPPGSGGDRGIRFLNPQPLPPR